MTSPTSTSSIIEDGTRSRDLIPPVNVPSSHHVAETVIEPKSGWQLVDFRELWRYRDLFWNLMWRNFKGRYAQSALGVGWVVVQPTLTLLIFSMIFGRVVRIPAPGGTPYILFAFCGVVPWSYFSGAWMAAASSLVSEAALFSKVYFPRLILPLTQVFCRLVDLGIMTTILLGVLLAYRQVPRPESLIMIPFLILVMTACAIGVGLWLSSLAVQYRDAAHIIGFLGQIWMYLSPVVYPASRVPERYQFLYSMNPMVGVIGGFRACFLGIPNMPWVPIIQATVISLLILVTGALYFRRTERIFADVV